MPWRQRIIEAFTKRLILKGTAVALSVLLWFVITMKEPKERWVEVHFTPQLDSSLVLRDALPPIHALVAGREDELVELLARPLVITKAMSANTPDTVVVDLGVQDVDVPQGVTVRDVQPRSVTLRFEPTSTKVVPVRSAVQVVFDSLTAPYDVRIRIDPDSVEVSGPRRIVLSLRSVSTTKAVIPAGDSLPHLVDIDTSRLGIRVKPPQVKALVVLPRN